jgi:hypothetical protein
MTGRYRAGRRLPGRRRAVTVQVGLAIALLAAVASPGRTDASSNAVAPEASRAPSEPASGGVEHPGQPCIELRKAPGPSAPVRSCVSDVSGLAPLGRRAIERGGERWSWVVVDGRRGWIPTATVDRLMPPDDVLRMHELADLADEIHSKPLPLVREPDGLPGYAEPASVDERDAGSGPVVLETPRPGGFVMGMAGTGDLETLIAAQSFPVDAVFALHLPTQTWLAHRADGPTEENTLDSRSLEPSMIVVVQRSDPPPPPPPPAPAPEVAAPAPEQPAEPAAQPASEPAPSAGDGSGSTGSSTSGGVARITYYYCERGSNPATWGDGGGFCGAMRSGTVVYAGAAACSAANFGQRFRIVGDPTGRAYVCEDTGGAVHGNHRDIWFRNSDEGARWYAQVGTHAEIVIVE